MLKEREKKNPKSIGWEERRTMVSAADRKLRKREEKWDESVLKPCGLMAVDSNLHSRSGSRGEERIFCDEGEADVEQLLFPLLKNKVGHAHLDSA